MIYKGFFFGMTIKKRCVDRLIVPKKNRIRFTYYIKEVLFKHQKKTNKIFRIIFFILQTNSILFYSKFFFEIISKYILLFLIFIKKYQ